MRIAFFVNSIEDETPTFTTTSLAMAALLRGHDICYLTPGDFVLRADAKWSDGTPITPDDWVFTFRHAGNPELDNPWAFFYYAIKGVQEYNTGTGTAEDIGVEKIDEGPKPGRGKLRRRPVVNEQLGRGRFGQSLGMPRGQRLQPCDAAFERDRLDVHRGELYRVARPHVTAGSRRWAARGARSAGSAACAPRDCRDPSWLAGNSGERSTAARIGRRATLATAG